MDKSHESDTPFIEQQSESTRNSTSESRDYHAPEESKFLASIESDGSSQQTQATLRTSDSISEKVKIEPVEEEDDEIDTERDLEQKALHCNARVVLKDAKAEIRSGKYGRVGLFSSIRTRNLKRRDDLDAQISSRKAWKKCVVPQCKTRDSNVGYFTFPSNVRNEEKRRLWIDAVQKKPRQDGTPWEPTRNSVICGEHFYSGRPSATRLDPDYVPSIFPWNGKHKPRTSAEIKQFRKLKQQIQNITDDIVKRKLGEIHGEKTERPGQTVRISYGKFSPNFDPYVFPTLNNAFSDRKEPRQISKAKRTKGSIRNPQETLSLEQKKTDVNNEVDYEELRSKINILNKEKTELEKKVSELQQKLVLKEKSEKILMKKIDELSENKENSVTRTFRGTQTRDLDFIDESVEFSDDEHIEMTPAAWTKFLKRQAFLRDLTKRRRESFLSIPNVSKTYTGKGQLPNVKRIKLEETPNSGQSSIPPLKKLQPVDPSQVPKSIRLAIEKALANNTSGQRLVGVEVPVPEQSNQPLNDISKEEPAEVKLFSTSDSGTNHDLMQVLDVGSSIQSNSMSRESEQKVEDAMLLNLTQPINVNSMTTPVHSISYTFESPANMNQ